MPFLRASKSKLHSPWCAPCCLWSAGTGKTMLACATATTAGARFFVINGPEVGARLLACLCRFTSPLCMPAHQACRQPCWPAPHVVGSHGAAPSPAGTPPGCNWPQVVSEYYGESEEKLRQLFKTAEEQAPSIILIDEN